MCATIYQYKSTLPSHAKGQVISSNLDCSLGLAEESPWSELHDFVALLRTLMRGLQAASDSLTLCDHVAIRQFYTLTRLVHQCQSLCSESERFTDKRVHVDHSLDRCSRQVTVVSWIQFLVDGFAFLLQLLSLLLAFLLDLIQDILLLLVQCFHILRECGKVIQQGRGPVCGCMNASQDQDQDVTADILQIDEAILVNVVEHSLQDIIGSFIFDSLFSGFSFLSTAFEDNRDGSIDKGLEVDMEGAIEEFIIHKLDQ